MLQILDELSNSSVVRRGTDDLDFFAAHPQPVAPMLDALETGLEEAGLRVTRLRAADTYARSHGSRSCRRNQPLRSLQTA